MSDFISMELDFLPVTSANGEGTTKSGDAILARLLDAAGRQKVALIDAGFQGTGEQVLEHLDRYYGTDVVDVAVSTHPDADHLNGLQTVVEQGRVGELCIHQPRLHTGRSLSEFTNLEAVDDLLNAARRHDTQISSPFTGEQRLGGALRLLGPDKDLYEDLLDEQLRGGLLGSAAVNLSKAAGGFRNLLDEAIGFLPLEETLTDFGETSSRNETSVVTLLQLGDQRIMLTGDVGMRGLERALDEYERLFGSFAASPLWIFQAPHHGSRRNVGPTLLDRILGPKHCGWGRIAVVSAADGAPKHPSPKVTNALGRRGCDVHATRGNTICFRINTPGRQGWVPLTPLPPLAEDGDDDA